MSPQVQLSVFSGLDAPANPWLEHYTTLYSSAGSKIILSVQGSHLHCEELYDQLTDFHDGVLTTSKASKDIFVREQYEVKCECL